jgi:hypothetical protein
MKGDNLVVYLSPDVPKLYQQPMSFCFLMNLMQALDVGIFWLM